MSPAAFPARPTSPEGRLLAEAGAGLASLLTEPPQSAVSWEVGTRLDRPRSSIFPLRATAEGRDLGSAFYKVMLPSAKGGAERELLRAERARTGLARSLEIESRLAGLLSDLPISFSRALAVDPDRLTTVTLGVTGEPFGNAVGHLLTPARIRRATGWMELTGRAARLIERSSPEEVSGREEERAELIDRRLRRAGQYLSIGDAERLRRRVEDVYGRAMAEEQPLTYAHGDFSSTNLLVGDGIGLIDFEWSPRLRGFDLANLVFRLQNEAALSSRLVAPLVGAALRGYGDPDLESSPFWQFHRISNLLKVIRNGPVRWHDRRSGRVRRAFAELETLAAAGDQ